MRIGTNPKRADKAPYNLTNVVLSCVTHLPNKIGYHENRLEIIKIALQSMVNNAYAPYSVVIWDNGSIKELRDWIRNEIQPSVFIESENIGKSAARKMLFSMLPPKTIVACSDDDMFHYPNWVQPQLKLLQTYPNVSAVTGYVVRTAFRWGCENTRKWANENASVTVGKLIPDYWEMDFCTSIGRDYNAHRQATLGDLDFLAVYNNVPAYLTAHHCQLLGYAGRLADAMIYDGYAMGDEKPFDIRLDMMGLRLGTVERKSRHMGNVIDPELRADIIANM